MAKKKEHKKTTIEDTLSETVKVLVRCRLMRRSAQELKEARVAAYEYLIP